MRHSLRMRRTNGTCGGLLVLVAAIALLAASIRAEVVIPNAAERAQAAKAVAVKKEAALREAVGRGDAQAMFDLAEMLRAGNSEPAEPAEVNALYTRAAEAGNWHAMFVLAERYKSGTVVEKDAAKAQAWSDKAEATRLQKAQAGDAGAMDELAGQLASAEKYPDALTWYLKAAETGDAKAMFVLADFLRQKGQKVGKDPNEAWPWMKKAADAGHVTAMLFMANKAPTGAEALVWYQKAADTGSVRAMRYIARLYRIGKRVPADADKAAEWYSKAASIDGYGLSELGQMYATGGAVKKDDALALKWYRKAAEIGDSEGMYELGMRYEHGTGVAKDLAEARRWYALAADAGDSAAAMRLARLGVERAPIAFAMKLPDIKFDAVKLGDAIMFIRDVTGMNIDVDWLSLQKAGVTPDTVVSIQLSHVNAKEGLTRVIDAACKGKATHAVIGGVVTVSTPEGVASRTALRKRHAGQEVDPAIETLLSRQLPEVAFDGVGLTDVLDFLRDVSGAKIDVDWDALKASGIDKNKPVSARLRNLPVDLALEIILHSADGNPALDYEIRNGVIVITNEKSLRKP